MSISGTPGSGLSQEQLREAIASLSTPDVVESPFGQLGFFDGVPTPATVSTVYDALDLMRGIDVFLNAIPGASLVALRRGLRSAGITSPHIVGITDPRANSNSLFLTPNTETTYGTTFLDLKAWGPTVIEAPPESLCVVDDFWFRYVADMGIPGPDQGKGGKYLYLPPAYDGEVPDGYYTYRCPTYTNWVVLRALGGVPAMKRTRIYPLSQAEAPEDNVFVNLATITMNTVHANDFSFFEELDELIQEEPVEALDAERAGQLAAIGLVKGQPFAPDDRLRGILSRAATIGAGMSRVIAYTRLDRPAGRGGDPRGRRPAAALRGEPVRGRAGPRRGVGRRAQRRPGARARQRGAGRRRRPRRLHVARRGARQHAGRDRARRLGGDRLLRAQRRRLPRHRRRGSGRRRRRHRCRQLLADRGDGAGRRPAGRAASCRTARSSTTPRPARRTRRAAPPASSPNGSPRSVATTVDVPVEQTDGLVAARGATVAGTQVHSLRLPSFVVSTEVVFALPDERLSIRHDAGSTPTPYVAGTLLAIRAVRQQTGLVRGLDTLLLGQHASDAASDPGDPVG